MTKPTSILSLIQKNIEEERERFVHAYNDTRKECLYTLEEVKKKYDL